MTRFIWVRDRDKIDHYVNVDHIIKVTKLPAHGSFSAAAYIMLRDGKEIGLSTDKYDTADDVITKIGVALA
jgi:hypothetical protein